MRRQLLFQFICSKSNLKDAWLKVQAKGSQGGIDGIGIDRFAAGEKRNLDYLRTELLQNRYTPEPYKRIYLSKFDGSGEKLPAIRDSAPKSFYIE